MFLMFHIYINLKLLMVFFYFFTLNSFFHIKIFLCYFFLLQIVLKQSRSVVVNHSGLWSR